MPRLTRRRVTWLVLLVGIGLLLAVASTTVILDVGTPEYELRLEGADPLGSAGAEVCASRDDAELVAAHLPPDRCRFRIDPDGIAGRRLTIFVTQTTREYGLPRRVTYTQQRHVAVVVILADGRRIGKAIELPDAREWEDEPREVTVRLD